MPSGATSPPKPARRRPTHLSTPSWSGSGKSRNSLLGRAPNDIEYGVRAVMVGEFIYYRPRIKAGVPISRVIHGARHQKRASKEN